MQKIIPCLWFDKEAEEAINFYCSLFPNSKVGKVTRYDEASAKQSGQPVGSVLTIECTLNGQSFTALNGGPVFKFNEAISFIVNCEDQAEVDKYWDALTKDGEEVQCGWLKDKFGLSWQIVPKQLEELLGDKDPGRASRAMAAMLKMKKIIIADLQKAADGT